MRVQGGEWSEKLIHQEGQHSSVCSPQYAPLHSSVIPLLEGPREGEPDAEVTEDRPDVDTTPQVGDSMGIGVQSRTDGYSLKLRIMSVCQ